ncbi:uncharacterized protein TNCV_4604091 [Trichonephila clavipes]|nr:uncharacterized protein TNCV_4604091 [Trichonephila clavipes]
MTPGMDPQSGLRNCAISALVQRSSGGKLLGSDLYQELRLKAKNSFRSRDGPSRAANFLPDIVLFHTPCVAAVAEWYRYRNVACLVTSSSPVPLKTRHVGQRCTLNLSRAETSSRWCGVVVRRAGCQLRCRPRHLTMVQNDVAKSPRAAELCDVTIQSIIHTPCDFEPHSNDEVNI